MDVRSLKDEAANYFGRGRFSKAAPLYAKLAQLEPDNPQHLLRQGDCLRHDGKKDKAIELYQQAATFHARGGALLKAIAAFKMILEIEPAHEPTRVQLEQLSRQRLSTRVTSPIYVPRPKPTVDDSAMELEDSTPSPSEPAETQPIPEPEPVRELPRIARPAYSRPEPPPIADLELDLPPSTPTVRIATSPSPDSVEALELDLEPAMSAAPPEPPPAVEPLELDLGTAEPPTDEVTSLLPSAQRSTGQEPEAELLALAAAAARREETPIGSTLSDAIRGDEFVDPSEIGLVALTPDEELNPEDVPQDTVPLFSELPHAAFLEILRDSVLRRTQPDEVIVREGDVGQSFFVLIRGTARVVKRQGDQQIELAFLEEGAFFGEVALLNGEPRMASVISVEECDLLEISQTLLRQLASAYPGVSRSIVRFYKERLLANVLSLSPLFRALDPGDRPPLLQKFILQDTAPDAIILKEGQKAEGLYVVMSGAALVTKVDTEGQVRPLALLREGDVFGEMSLLTRRPVSATVTAKGPTILLMLPKTSFDEVISTYPVVLEAVSDLSDLRASLNEKALSDSDVTRSGSVPRV